jgi:Family of unknown function (DUF6492)
LKDIVLYCKSYRRDFFRLKRLLDSIEKFNQDRIPFFISTPEQQHQDLIAILGNEKNYQWVSDESIVTANPRASLGVEKLVPGGLAQQIIKSEFWRLGVSENYVCLDSDCVFIKPFSHSDFLASDNVPFVVLHQNREYFQLAANRGEVQIINHLRDEARRVQALFNRVGPEYYFAPAPFIWSAKVWRSLDHEYLRPRGKTIWDLIAPDIPESLVYGEALLAFKAIPMMVIEPLFRVYHYNWQYFLMRRLGETEEKLKLNFLGVIYQSNWDSSFNAEENKKPLLSRTLKNIKSFFRFLQSYI